MEEMTNYSLAIAAFLFSLVMRDYSMGLHYALFFVGSFAFGRGIGYALIRAFRKNERKHKK